MILTLENLGTAPLIRVNGRIDTLSSPELETLLGEKINANHSFIVLDLSQVDYLSSSAFRVFIKTQKQCRIEDGELIIQGVQTSLMPLFKLSGFEKLFTFTDTDQESLAVFGAHS